MARLSQSRQMAEHEDRLPVPQRRVPGPFCSRGADAQGSESAEKLKGMVQNWKKNR